MSELEQYLINEFKQLGIERAKVTATPPSGSENAVFDLAATLIDPDGPPDGEGGGGLSPTGVELTWTERLIGDYDQNGEVGIADLVPISQYWHEIVVYDHSGLHGGMAYWPSGSADDVGSDEDVSGSGAYNWRVARVDGDANSEIGIADITPNCLALARADGRLPCVSQGAW
ncbi:hypothetical protein IIA79_04040 [bacterium]|nr:hypothetical protein [bacterium]